MHRLARQGSLIHHLVFSGCEESVPAGFEPKQLRDECVLADATLGIKKTEILDFRVRYLPEARQKILQAIYDIRESFDVILAPWEFDRHQDHETVAKEALRATKNTPVVALQYEVPANCPNFAPSFFVEVSKEDMRAKIEALRAYKTQSVKNRLYFKPTFWMSTAVVRGGQAGVLLAEGFVMYRGVVKV